MKYWQTTQALFFAVWLILTTPGSSAASTLYKFIDQNHKVVYSDKPPQTDQVEIVNVEIVNPTRVQVVSWTSTPAINFNQPDKRHNKHSKQDEPLNDETQCEKFHDKQTKLQHVLQERQSSLQFEKNKNKLKTVREKIRKHC